MNPKIARALNEAYARQIRPRMDFTTEEGRAQTMRLAPYLAPLMRPGIRALDLGCSFGKSALLLCELGANVIGVDVSIGALRFASALGRSICAKLNLACADYTKLPFCENSFELALFPHNVVECSLAEFESVVSETSRVLITTGVFAVSVANKWAENGADPVLKNGTITIPEEGTLSYPTYSWSSKAVQRIVSPWFHTIDIADMPERAGIWMVFKKRMGLFPISNRPKKHTGCKIQEL